MPRVEHPMSEERLEAVFQGIARRAIHEAEAERIPFEQFVAGLKIMASDINDRLQTAEEELAGQG